MAVPKTIIFASLPGRTGPAVVSYGSNSKGSVSLLSAKPKLETHMVGSRCKISSISSVDYSSSSDDVSVTDATKPPARKRQRLDHLTLEEKIMRRKVKNRVAAQSARDRKKAQMSELEYIVKQLMEEKESVLEENFELQEKNSILEKENEELKRRLGLMEEQSQQKQAEATVKVETSECKSVKHASLISGPLQKEQDLHPRTPLMMQLVCLQMIMSLMTFLSCYKNVVKNFSSATSIFPLQMNQSVREEIVEMKPNLKWWGAHQKTWNPSKN